MSRFDCIQTPIEGLKVIQRTLIGDTRGFLSRLYCTEELKNYGFNKPITQINHTLTQSQGTVRGLHFQLPPYAEIKLVSCIKGEIFDVAVDLRINSPTFLHWHAEILSADNHRSLLIPEGFAHGFQTLTKDCELIYLHTAPYQPNAEGALNVLDSTLNIHWPITIKELSDRDRAHAMLTNDFQGLIL